MMAGEFPVSFGLTGAAKDARLIQEALRSAGVSDRLDAAVLATMEAAVERLRRPRCRRHRRDDRGAGTGPGTERAVRS